MNNKFNGFTYVEALMTLFIIAIIAAVSAPMITKATKKPPSMGGSGGAPLGTIVMFPLDANILPTGWIECDGRDISKENGYPRLRNVIKADHVPDLRGTYLIQVPDEMLGTGANNNGGGVIRDSYGRVKNPDSSNKYGGSGNYGYRPDTGTQHGNDDAQTAQMADMIGQVMNLMQNQKPVKVRWIIRAQ